jgi:HSP20 family protein
MVYVAMRVHRERETIMLFSPMGPDPFALMRRLQQPVAARGFPSVNVWQGADSIAVTAELPGVEPADIDIQVKEDLLTISGERKPAQTEGEVAWHRRERGFGRFSRAIQLPHRVDADTVEARFQDGVLQIELHRPEADKPRRIEIKAA